MSDVGVSGIGTVTACDPLKEDFQGNIDGIENEWLDYFSAYSLIRKVPAIHQNLRRHSVGVILVML